MSPRQRVVVHMAENPRITLRALAACAGIALTDIKAIARLVDALRADHIFQVTTNRFESMFELQPDRDPNEPMVFDLSEAAQ